MRASEFATQYDDLIREPFLAALYGDSGYFNVGYWYDGCGELTLACDRLVDMLAAAVPVDARAILDIGCGVGAGTARLATHFPKARLIAGNLSHWQLTQARQRGVREPVVMNATRLAIASGALDAVIAMESAQHFNTRERFFAEAFRALRPGGTFVLADMLFNDREPIGSWMLPPENRVGTTEEYAALLASAGFVDIEVRDITERTWRPFCDLMRVGIPGGEQFVTTYENSLDIYLMATARKAPARRTSE
jgi:cyclopropane fatty-acyl-phospholipid synthase-like methyltransferase